jgi:hypothetical protein
MASWHHGIMATDLGICSRGLMININIKDYGMVPGFSFLYCISFSMATPMVYQTIVKLWYTAGSPSSILEYGNLYWLLQDQFPTW